MKSPWKKDFPALSNNSISYLDSAATCQAPSMVINTITQTMQQGLGNAGRGMHGLGENADNIIINCRQRVAEFIGCYSKQVIFTKSTTESINLVAHSFRETLSESNSILITEMEHHSNLIPWQRLCQQTGARLNVLPLKKDAELDLSKLNEYLQDNCKLFAFTHGSNILGIGSPVEFFIQQAKKHQVKTLIDGAQSIAHHRLNLKQLDCDFYAFSGHKLYSGGGCGILYCKSFTQLEPLILGGGSVSKTSYQGYLLNDGISKFEAGSANLIAIAALLSGIEYIQKLGMDSILSYEKKLNQYLTDELKNKTAFRIVSHKNSHSLVSFYSDNYHCHDIASLLAEQSIAIRAGHHCAQPCLNAIGLKHCLRASIGLYNDSQDIDRLIMGINHATKVLS